MTDLRTAAQQALEALEWFNKYGTEEHGPSLRGAEHALHAALTEPVEPAFNFKEPQPGMVNLDAYHAFHFNDPPKGGFVGEMEMVKWLVRNRDGDYWKAKYGRQEPPCATRECMPSQCPNCASLEAQNTELDRKLAEMERKPLSEEELSKIIDAEIGFNSCVGWEEAFARAIERAHGIGDNT